MTQLWMDGFDHYGGDINTMLEGSWSDFIQSILISLDAPVVGARTGLLSLKLRQLNSFAGSETSARRVLGGDFVEVFIGMGFYLEAIPISSRSVYPFQLQTNAGVNIATVTIRGDGGIIFRSGSNDGTILGQTSGPALVANTWHHLEIRILRDAAAGIFEIRVDEVQVLNLTGLALGADNIAQLLCGMASPVSVPGEPDVAYIDDLITRSSAGTRNNGFEGDLRVATLQPIANGVAQGWTNRPIAKLGLGVADFTSATRDKSYAFADDPAFNIGSGDFCIETFVRLNTVPASTDEMNLISKYQAAGDQRSWRLKVDGPTSGGNLVFETNTLGTAGDDVEVHAFPFIPIKNRHYHIAVSREGTTSRMFLDGTQIGLDQVDSRAYFDSTAKLFINALQNGASTVIADSGNDGWMDGTRITIGAARYTANFTPPSAPLPNTVGGDALYNSVALLLNYDDAANTDESVNAFVDEPLNAPGILFPDDALAYQSINDLDPRDTDFVEAALVAATGTLTFGANPLDTETVVLGGTTYTFQTVLVDVADNVLIGADAEESLNNLIAAINLEAGEGTLYGTGTVQNLDALGTKLPSTQALGTARTPGAAGNSITTTTTVTGSSWSAATLLGGLDIPTNSEFTVSRLPPEVTSIKSVAIVGRLFKTDSGSSQVQMSFVKSGGASLQGADRPVTLSPTDYEDTFETDPQTAGDLTPATLIDARIRLNRTA